VAKKLLLLTSRQVPYPVDLSLITARLKGGYYRCLSGFLADTQRLAANAARFNDEASLLPSLADIIVDTISIFTLGLKSPGYLFFFAFFLFS
jgi:hypothetical protein